MSKNEISGKIGIPRTTLSSIVNTDLICEILGFCRTTLKPKGSSEVRDALIKTIELEYIAYLRKLNKSVSFFRFLKECMGLSTAKASKYYRYDISVELCHLAAGIKYLPGYGTDPVEAARILQQMILDKGRYISSDELASRIGITGSAIRQLDIDVILINKSLGMTYRGKSFELYVLELLGSIYPDYTVEMQKTFEDCLSVKGRKLRFDFFIPELNTLIEVDGDQHYYPNHPWYSVDQVGRDATKTAYCLLKNIHLVRITSKDFKNLIEVISGIPLKLSVGQPAAKSSES